MNLRDANIVLRARSPLESVDLAFPFIARLGGRRYFMLAVAVLVPLAVTAGVLRANLDLTWADTWMIAAPAAVWIQGLFTAAAGETLFANDFRTSTVVRAFARRLLPYTAALLISRSVIVLAAFSVVLLPFAWARFLFVPEAVLLEGASVGEALARAARLGRAHRGRMTELVVALAALLVLGVVIAESFGHAIFQTTLKLGLDAGDLYVQGGSYYALSGLFAAIPLCATVRFLSYIDGRARGDAWDVQVKFQRIAQAETSGS